MTNKFFSSVDGNHSRVASVMHRCYHRSASVSFMSGQSLLPILLLCLTLFIGAGQMWANYSLTFSTGSGDGTSSSTSTTASSCLSGGSDYVTGNLATASNVYRAGSAGLKLGTSSGAGNIKMNLSNSGKVYAKKIIVSAKRYNSSKAATVNINGGTAQNVTADFANYSFTINGNITYVQIQSSKYIWVESVRVVDCDAPTAVTKGTITSNSVALTITDASNVGTYEVYYSTSSTAPNDGTTISTTVNTKTPTVTGLNASTTYYLWVRSKCSNTSKSDWCALTGSSFTTASAAPAKTLSSISVQTAPTKKKYVAGEMFDPTGLIITRTYSDATSDTYTYANHTSDFTFSPTTSTALTTSNTLVSITYGGKSTSQAINVYNVTMQARDEDGNAIPAGGPGAPSRTGKSITPAADANNYVFKQWQVTNASLGSGESTKSNTITNPTEAVTVTAVYYKPITITYKANGQDFTTQTYGYGGTLAFPASEPDGDDYSCTGKTFTGWVAEANKDYKHASTAPTYATASGSVTTAANYYAVFATASGSGSDKYKVTTSLSAGKTYVMGAVKAEASTTLANNTAIGAITFSTTYSSTSWGQCTSVTPNASGEIAANSVTDAMKWTLESITSGNYAFKKGNNYMYLKASSTGSNTCGLNTSANVYLENATSTCKDAFLMHPQSGTGGNRAMLNGSSGYRIYGTNTAASSSMCPYVRFYEYTPGVTYSNYATTCCTPLVSINGSISLTQSGNDLVASGWGATTGGNETGYLVKLYNNDKSSVITSGSTDGTAKTYTFENPGAGTYWVSVTPTYSGAGNYCASGDETFSAESIDISGKMVITFKKNGATGTDDQTQEVDYNTETALEDISARSYTAPSCKEFGGWASSEANATAGTVAYANGANITVTEATTLWAIWKTKTFAVTDGTIAASVASHSYSAASIACGSDLTITCAAAAAYKGNPTVTATGTHGDITVNSATSVTIANVQSAIAVSIAYNTPKETATVILHDATGAHTQDGSYYEADNYTLPNTAAACTESELYGWYTETYVDQPTAPSGEKYIAKEASKALVAGENHFYAVYATIEDHYTNNYTKITSEGDLTNGDYLISSGSYCMGNTIQSTNRMAETSVSAVGDVKTTDSESLIWTIAKSGTKVTLYNANKSKYLAVSGGVIAVQTDAHNFTFDYGTTKANSWTFTSESSPTYQLSYSTISGNTYSYFVMNTSQGSQIDLYKRDKVPSAGAPYTTSPSCTTHDLTSAIEPISPVSGTVDLGKTTILEGKTTTAEATPSAHYTFSHWTITGTGASLSDANANPVTVEMGTEDAKITAHFTEKEKCTVEFYNNGGDAISSTTYWLGETPEAPTLTDGHDHDACDETSTTHYGWTQTAWSETLSQSQVDDRTAADVKVYAKAAALPAVAAGDNGKTIKYHAVWTKETDNSVSKNYTLSLTSSNFPSAYGGAWPNGGVVTAHEINDGPSTFDVTITGNDIGTYNNIQFKASTGYFYNTTDLGNITGINTNNASISYRIGASENPSSEASGGFFKIYNESTAKNTSSITINFTKTVGSIAYSAFLTTCTPSHAVSSAVDPTGKATVTLGANSVAEGSTTTAEYSAITAGYEFVNWTISGTGASLDDNTANPTTITMGTADVTVTANLQCVKPTFTVHPASKTNYLTTDVATALGYTASAAGASLTQQWQVSADNDSWDDIEGAVGTAETYTPNIATEGTKYYRVIVTNSACGETATSQVATITSIAPSGYCISLFNSNNNGIQSGFSNGGSGNEYTLAFVVPGKDGSNNWPEYWIGENEAWASFSANATIADMKFTSSDGTLGLAEGATGTLHIWDDNKTNNLHAKFEPDGYGFRWGDHNSDDWTAEACTKAFTVDAGNANTYWTELVTLDGTNNTGWDYYVGLQTASGYVYSGVDNEASDSRGISRTRSVTTMKVSNGTAGQYKETFLNSEATGTTGKFRIWNNNITDYNFVCHFVPFYQLKYNANGGTGTMDPLPATPVSCEESAANRTVTVAANAFTAPTGKQFVKWNTAANGSGADVAAGAYELTGDVTLYAIWADADYTVTVNQSPAAGATTTGQTNAAHYGATINLTTTVPEGYEFVNWTSDDVTVSNPESEDGASFTMPAQNVTVTANFQQIYTITWSANGATTTSTVNAGNKLVLPVSDPTTCNAGYSTFIGWYSVPAGSAEDPSDNISGTKADANHTPTGNETWYAVWANGELVGGWQKATSIAVGDVVLFVHDVATKKELTGVANNIGTATSYDTELAGSYPLTVMEGSADDSYAFKNGNNYLSYSGSGNNLYTSEDLDAASSWTINASEGGNFQFANANSTTRILQFNNSQYRWACYTGTQQAFQIYKQIASATEFISGCCTEWSAPAISYSTPEHWKAGDDDVAVSIADGDTYGAVSFESSNEEVLTVDAETGAITAVAMGTATITATWAGGVFNAVRYCSASSSVEVAVSGIVTVMFNGNDATSGSMSNQEMYYNEATALNANAFSKTGYTFYGWAETEQKADAGDRDYAGGASVTFTTDKTLYAAWTINKHAVTLNQPTGNTIEATGAANLASVAYGTEITLSATENDGYVFTGWSITGATVADASAKSTTFSMPDNDVTVTATYSTYSWIAADPRYTVTTDPKIEYYKVEKFSTAGVVIKENFKRSDDNTITKQETYAGAWTAKLNGEAIVDGADLSLEDDGKTLKLYIGEDEIASYTLTVNNIDVDQFVVGIWDIEAPSFQINTYTMPTLSNQTAGDAATCKDHNIFIGWTTDPDDPKDANITAGGKEGIVASNTTYYAVWAKNGTITDDVEKNSFVEADKNGATLNAGISYTTAQNGATKGAGIYNEVLRLYQKSEGGYGGYILFTAASGYTITAIVLTTSSGTKFGYGPDKDHLTQGTISNGKVTLTNLSVSAMCIATSSESGSQSDRLNISAMTVYYETTGAVDYITDCETRYTIEFYADQTLDDKVAEKKHKLDAVIEMPDKYIGMSKEYHTFAGWRSAAEYTASIDKVYAVGEEYTVTDDDYIYGEWTPFSQGAVTVDGEALEGSPFYATQSYTLPTPDAISGKKFIGWSDGENIVAPGEYTMPDPAVNITYTSQWFDLLPTPSGVSFTNGEWILVTAQEQLHAGDFIVVAAANADYAMGTEASGGNNRTVQAVTKSGNTLSYESDVQPLFLQNGYGANQYALYDMSAEKYLYAASSNNNYLKIDTDFDQNGSWLITIANGSTSVMAQGANTHNDLRYNAGGSIINSVFSCYAEGGQQPIALYRWIETIKTEGNVNASDVMPTYNVNLVVQTNTSIDMNVERTVNDFYIEAMEGESGQITNPDNLNINGNAYYDLTLNTSGTMDNSKWYAFAVPFQVDAATGIQRLSNDGKTSNAGFNSHYVLLKYNSAAYASAGQGWEYVTRGETLDPGKFYMIALNSNEYNRVRMTKKAGTPVNNKANLTLSTVGTGIHANWNALANNALAYANVSATGLNADLKVQVYKSAEDSYAAYEYGKVTFTVGTPFFIQVAEAGTMNVDIAATYNENVKAPARYAVSTEEFQIRLGENTESYFDLLYVSASDEALNEYQIGHDLSKAGVSTTVPQMYVPAYGAKLCDAEFPLVNNEATFPLTFTAPNAGTYQLYISKAATDAELFLTKDGSVIWNLSTGAYALTLEKGTTENYGLLLKAAKTPTGIDDVQSDKVQCTKVVLDDHVYILRGGKMYDVTGKAVR